MDISVRTVCSFFVSLLLHCAVEAGIGCFKCFSINGSDPACGDPFMPASGHYYRPFCRQTKHQRVGDFPAKYCTKIKGINTRTKTEMLVRTCDMESFDNTCGTFIFQGDQYHGCLMSCKTNACNAAPPSPLAPSATPFSPTPFTLCWLWWWWWWWLWGKVKALGSVGVVGVVVAFLIPSSFSPLFSPAEVLWEVVCSLVNALSCIS